ncbi:MAG: response regulator transcription factor [Erysipelothrix sp.]|nr:response regulator transcription factor [Erysipelothrix sp.]
MKILVVDDEVNILEIVKEYASFYGYECVGAKSGLEAIEKVREEDFDVIIMDIMMPDLDGFVATRRIKNMKDIPVVMLSARHDESDKLYGFEMGVDDYMTKPFSVKELMARINAVTLRKLSSEKDFYLFDGLKIDVLGRLIIVDGERVNLPSKEFDLLLYFVRQRNMVLSRERILDAVWGEDFDGDIRTVDTHVKLLRANLGDRRGYLKTIRGTGYKFEADI